MDTVPNTKIGKIEFYESKLSPWGLAPASIGLQPSAVSALATATAAARAAYSAHLSAMEASKAATQFFYDKVRSLHAGPGLGADMIQQIKTFAQTTNNPNVYVLAQIPGPSSPGEIPAPGTPFDFKVGLLQSGALELRWKCPNPEGAQGTMYEVRRKATHAGTDFEFLGATGGRTFVDDTLSVGGGAWMYQITAVRSTARGHPANFLVNFGVGEASGASAGGGLAITTLGSGENTAGKAARLAA